MDSEKKMSVNRLNANVAEGWNKELARLIDHIRLSSFPEILESALKHAVSFDALLMVTYKYTYKPIVVRGSYPPQFEPAFARYINKFYVLDPLFNALQNGMGGGVYRLKEICPDSFESTEYFNSCYRDFDLVDEIIIVTPLENDVVFTISLGRKSDLRTITRAERTKLNLIFPVISALIHQFWLAQSNAFIPNEKSQKTLAYALQSFGSGVLTPREQEITGLILQGHSSKAIAKMLDISAGTVKVHRKNIHSRLNTSTQSELFYMFLGHLESLA